MLVRQASNRSYSKYIYSSIKTPFMQMIGELFLELAALMVHRQDGEGVEQKVTQLWNCVPGKTTIIIIKITFLYMQLQWPAMMVTI